MALVADLLLYAIVAWLAYRCTANKVDIAQHSADIRKLQDKDLDHDKQLIDAQRECVRGDISNGKDIHVLKGRVIKLEKAKAPKPKKTATTTKRKPTTKVK